VGPENLRDTLTIIGCGAVGSNVAVLAAKMGWTRFSLWDNDLVEDHNLANQAFDVHHIGMPKVQALEEVLKRFNPAIQVTTHNEFFTPESEVEEAGPMVIATDTMSSRAEIMEAVEYDVDVDHVFETRLGFDFGIVNVVNNSSADDLEQWRATLRDDSEVPDGPCNQRMCTTLVWATASHLVHTLCSKYAAEKAKKPWVYSTRGFFTLRTHLQTYHPCDEEEISSSETTTDNEQTAS